MMTVWELCFIRAFMIWEVAVFRRYRSCSMHGFLCLVVGPKEFSPCDFLFGCSSHKLGGSTDGSGVYAKRSRSSNPSWGHQLFGGVFKRVSFNLSGWSIKTYWVSPLTIWYVANDPNMSPIIQYCIILWCVDFHVFVGAFAWSMPNIVLRNAPTCWTAEYTLELNPRRGIQWLKWVIPKKGLP